MPVCGPEGVSGIRFVFLSVAYLVKLRRIYVARLSGQFYQFGNVTAHTTCLGVVGLEVAGGA